MNRAERRSRKQAVINKRVKELKQVDRDMYEYLCTRSKINSLSKRDAYDCGQACFLCNPGKFSNKDNKGYKTTDTNTYKGDITDE